MVYFNLLPTDGCCCCVPRCCGLRGGVMTIAILQTLIGAFYLIQAFATIISALSVSNNSETYWQYGLLFLFYFAIASIYICLGAFGFAATLNFKAVLQLSFENAVRPASRYYEGNKWAMVVVIPAMFIGAVFQTMGILLDTYANDVDDPVLSKVWQVVTVLMLIWVVAIFCICCQLYFLYITWSYKYKLEGAFYGYPYGQFVLKREVPAPVKPVLGKMSPLMIPSGNDWESLRKKNLQFVNLDEALAVQA